MVSETGIVESVDGARAKVKTKRTEACGGCSAKGACHSLGGGKEMLVEVDNSIGAAVGSQVEIVFDSGALMTGSALAYLVPVLALIVGAMAGQRWGPLLGLNSDLAAGLMGLGLAFGVGVVCWRRAQSLDQRPKYRPRIRRILQAGAPARVKG